MDEIEGIILTDAERQKMVAKGYRRVRLTMGGQIQVAKIVEETLLYSPIHGSPGGSVFSWEWVNWPIKEDS